MLRYDVLIVASMLFENKLSGHFSELQEVWFHPYLFSLSPMNELHLFKNLPISDLANNPYIHRKPCVRIKPLNNKTSHNHYYIICSQFCFPPNSNRFPRSPIIDKITINSFVIGYALYSISTSYNYVQLFPRIRNLRVPSLESHECY